MSVVDYTMFESVKDFEAEIKEHDIESLYELSLDKTLGTLIETSLEHDKFNTCKPLNERCHEFKDIEMHKRQWTMEQYTRFIRHEVVKNTVNLASSGYLGHMTAPLPKIVPELSSLIAKINQNQVKVETSNVLTLVERQVIGECHSRTFKCSSSFYNEYLHESERSLGVITSGGTMANITSLAYALNKALGETENFEGMTKKGLAAALKHYGYESVVIIGSERMHYSIEKTAKLMGLGEYGVLRVKTDHNGRVDTKQVRETVQQCIDSNILVLSIVGVAGATETGQVDPLVDLADIAQRHQIHYHVDAAWGGAYVFSDTHRSLVTGIERADTVTICAHKQLYSPMGVSFCLFKDPDFVMHSEHNASYQCKKGSYDLGRYTIEGSRPASVLYLHALLNLWGERGFSKVFDSTLKLRDIFVSRAAMEDSLCLKYEPELNIIVYRYIPSEIQAVINSGSSLSAAMNERINNINIEIQKRLFSEGNTFCSATVMNFDGQNSVFLRTVLCNPLAKEVHIIELLEEQKEIFNSILS